MNSIISKIGSTLTISQTLLILASLVRVKSPKVLIHS